jgi:hypothetical protein
MKKKSLKYLGASALILLSLSPLVDTINSVAYAKTESVSNVEDTSSALTDVTTTKERGGEKNITLTADIGTITRDLVDNTVTYTANSTEYIQGAYYQGTITFTNTEGNEIPAGSQIVLSISPNAIDYNSLDLSDPQISQFFNVTIDQDNGEIIFTVKTDIIGQINVTFVIGGTIIGDIGQDYSVDLTTVDISGNNHSVVNNSPSFSVINDSSVYGVLNAFWGKGPNETGQYIGKNMEDIEGLPTGIFSRSCDEIQNFIQINPLGTYELPHNYHYKIAWLLEPYSGNANVNIDLNDIKVYNDDSGKEFDKSWYTISRDPNNQNEIWIEFKSPDGTGGMLGSKTQIRVSLGAHVSNDSITYHSDSFLYIKVDNGGIGGDSYEFPLNNIFKNEGESTIFPNLKVEDKTFYVDYLNDKNIEGEILKNITAEDTVDGDITGNIKVEYSKVKPNVIGDYEVTYTVTNSTGHISTRTAIVHIIEHKDGAPVTVKYVDEDGQSISPDVVLQGKIDDIYESKPIVKDGYELISTPDNAKGVYTEEEQTVTYVYRGHLIFVDAPKTINFGEHVLSDKDETYFPEAKDGDLKVQDFRKIGSDWILTAQLKSNFIGEKFNKALNGTLDYTDSKGNTSPISTDESTLIYSAKTENHEIENISENWSDTEGLSLNVKTGGALLDKYDANIEWTVSDTVPNE